MKTHQKVKPTPRHALSYYDRGIARLNADDYATAMKDFEQAIRLLDETIELEPDNAFAYLCRAKTWLGKNTCARCMEEESNFFDEAIRDFDEAIRDFDEAIKLDSTCLSAYVERGKAWQRKDDNKAIKDFNEAIRLDPDNALFYFYRGGAHSRKRNYEKAIEDYGKAIELDPRDRSFYRDRAKAWMGKMDHDKAIKDFDDFIRLDPSDAYAYRSRAEAWIKKKEYDKAIEDLNEAIQRDPNHAFFYYRRGEMWCLKKKYDVAIMDFEHAIERSPTFSSPYGTLAWLLSTCSEEKFRDARRAIELATKACELNELQSGWALDILAAAYAEAGQFDEAVRYQTKALEDRGQRANWDEFRKRLELYKQKKPFRQSI
jgi:tetratricopeptide (TPR) repeat protein